MSPSLDDAERIRWEARPHERIYHEIHTAAEGVTGSLADSVQIWSDAAGDIGDVLSRYQQARNRLLEANAGPSAAAADASARLVTLGLTRAQDLARLAGARRARLSELNEQLRNVMPEPVAPIEQTSGFLGMGTAWLAAPDFTAGDRHRNNRADHARELMRKYEDAVAYDRLVDTDGSAAPQPPAGTAASYANERTVPRVITPQPPPTPAPPQPPPAAVPSWVDFGPRGHAELDHAGSTPADEEAPTQPVNRPRQRPEPTARPWSNPWTPASPFDIADELPPPVIGWEP